MDYPDQLIRRRVYWIQQHCTLSFFLRRMSIIGWLSCEKVSQLFAHFFPTNLVKVSQLLPHFPQYAFSFSECFNLHPESLSITRQTNVILQPPGAYYIYIKIQNCLDFGRKLSETKLDRGPYVRII